MNSKVKYIIAALSAAAITLSAAAQAPARKGHKVQKDKWETRMESEKIAFLTKELDLSPEEAQVFWPVYNEVAKEKKAQFSHIVSSYKALEEAVAAGKEDKDIRKLLDAYVKAEQSGKELAAGSVAKYLKVLPESKVAKLLLGEEKFRKQQIHNLKRGTPPRQGSPKGAVHDE